jgi:hypothetical protein
VGKKMIYRWFVDEEFGTVFFHDHLFANFRQKHGLFGAMIAEPPGAKVLDPHSHEPIETGLEAVVVPGSEPCDAEFEPFREFCFALADFIPMFDPHGTPLNPPTTPGHHSDQGVMAVNYRNEPIRERGGDPAFWFHSQPHDGIEHGDPATNVFQTYPNDPIRIRLLQGSHEEQHSFQIHGMRWRQFLRDPHSPLRNQQTIGISEAFSFEVNQESSPYGPGDHLWKSSPADDLWLGVWGLIRVHKCRVDCLPMLPRTTEEIFDTPAMPAPMAGKTRRFRIVAERQPLVYRKFDLVDPFALVYRLEAMFDPVSSKWIDSQVQEGQVAEPLILRCRQGEWVEIELVNNLPERLRPEPFAPEVPLEKRNRPVSSQVSLHADLLRYNVYQSDGANVGHNPVQTALPGKSVRYLWYADQELGPVLLQDLADFRNHRHHGLVGALVVEAANVIPLEPGTVIAADGPVPAAAEAWCGAQATLYHPTMKTSREEIVLILQDGLRLYFYGNPAFPIPDVPPDPGEDRPDPEDQGQKGFNYRSEPVGEPTWLHLSSPATPVFNVPAGADLAFRLIVGADKPRNHSFTIHDHTWITLQPMGGAGQRVGAVSALSSGQVETLRFRLARTPGDYAYRSGVLRWALPQGLWGIIRVKEI